MIGLLYHYPNCNKSFKLSKIDGYSYIFECGHKVTDNVFKDLKLVEPFQTSLNLE